MLIGDINAHINEGDLDYIQHDMNDILDDALPENYIADNIHLLRNTQSKKISNSAKSFKSPIHTVKLYLIFVLDCSKEF